MSANPLLLRVGWDFVAVDMWKPRYGASLSLEKAMRLIFTGLLLAACSTSEKQSPPDTAGPQEWRPDVVCPGDPGCANGEGELQAGAGAVPITPTCWEKWLDCGDDGICPGDTDWIEADSGEGNGEYDKQH